MRGIYLLRGGLALAVSSLAGLLSLAAPVAAQQAGGIGGNFGGFFIANFGDHQQQAAGPALPMGPQAGLAAELRAAAGRELFEHRWQEKDQRSPAGDGIGPRFNAGSCAECHKQGGVGGGGVSENDVDLVTLLSVPQRKKAPEIATRFAALGPGGGKTVILHKQSSDQEWERIRFLMHGVRIPAPNLTPDKSAREWAKIRDKLQDRTQPVRRIDFDGASLRISRRQTPALFGLGQIDAIPAEVLKDEAARQAKEGKVSGRVGLANTELVNPYVAQPQHIRRSGKFGWRGQIGSLREFVLAACSNELGLETPAHAQPAHPTNAEYKAPGLDINEEQCEQLVSFVSRLPQPKQIMPTDPAAAATVRLGESLFQKVGCTQCHTPNLGNVEGIYSDLLLHDLGTDLIDPVPANFEGSGFGFGSYFGGGVPLDIAESHPELFREWRTPPLWGVRDSAPYLHDGRAPDLTTAITLHGGEATASKNAFLSLARGDKEDQKALLAFLRTLAAPEDAPK